MEATKIQSAVCDRNEVPIEMSNFDHTIDAGMAETLKAGHVFGRHSAWNFNGLVWFDAGQYHEEVWCYHSPVGVRSADTLKELMRMVNDEYGNE